MGRIIVPRKPIPPEQRKRAPGGGRKPTLPDNTEVNTRIPNADLEAIEDLRGTLTQSEAIREAIRQWVERRRGEGGGRDGEHSS